jgi:hypothetical protein
MASELKVFRDSDRFIIGAREWQTCLSMTMGVAEAYSVREAKALVQKWSSKSAQEIEAAKRVYWTDGRFEAACDAGRFGSPW